MEEVAGEQLGGLELLVAQAGRRDALELRRHVVRARELAAHLVERAEREQHGHAAARCPRAGRRARARAAATPRPRAPTSRRWPRAPARARTAARPRRAMRSGSSATCCGGVERGAQVADALGVRVARERALGGEPQEAHGPLGVAAREEVEAELGRALGHLAGRLGQVLAHAGVQLCARVRRAAGRRGPRGGGRAGTRGTSGVVLDQARPARELAAAQLDGVGVAARGGGERGDREAAAGDARGLSNRRPRVSSASSWSRMWACRVGGTLSSSAAAPRVQAHPAAGRDERARRRASGRRGCA